MTVYIVIRQEYKARGEIVGVYTSRSTASAVREAVWKESIKSKTKGVDCWIETKLMDM